MRALRDERASRVLNPKHIDIELESMKINPPSANTISSIPIESKERRPLISLVKAVALKISNPLPRSLED